MSKYPAPKPVYLGPPAKASKGSNKPIYRIVLHGTVSPTAKGEARKIAAYFRSPNAGGSAHYVVDPGEVVQAAYDSVICWHAPPNSHSIGVEFCDWVAANNGRGGALPLSRWDGGLHADMLARGARLVAELCLAYDVPVQLVGPAGLRSGKRGICEHSDVSEAWRQSSHWDLGNFPRRRFLSMVQAEVAAIKAKQQAPAAAPPQPVPVTRVTKARDLLEAAYRNTRSKVRRARIQRGLDALPRS